MGDLSTGVPSKKLCSESHVDAISSLPEGVLTFMLSLLPTKDAVQTSVLAKKWQYLWISVDSLDFDDRLFVAKEKPKRTKKVAFTKFVDRVLLLTDGHSIKTFRLACAKKYKPSVLTTWISTALSRDVQKLDVVLPLEAKFELPVDLFSSSSLRELMLDAYSLNFSTLSSMPNLVVLDLKRVTFVDELSSSGELRLTLPALEVFKTLGCRWLNVKLLKLIAPRLATLHMTNCEEESSLSAIEIDGDSLSAFNSGGSYLEDLIPSKPSLLTHAALRIGICCVDGEVNIHSASQIARRAALLMKKFTHLEYLEVSGEIIKAFLDVTQHSTPIPLFGKLTTLKLTANFRCGPLFGFLQRTPKLEYLLCQPGLGYMCSGRCDSELVPECISKSLKVVELKEFCGIAHEIALVKYLLKNALVLQELRITLPPGGRGFFSSDTIYRLLGLTETLTGVVVMMKTSEILLIKNREFPVLSV